MKTNKRHHVAFGLQRRCVPAVVLLLSMRAIIINGQSNVTSAAGTTMRPGAVATTTTAANNSLAQKICDLSGVEAVPGLKYDIAECSNGLCGFGTWMANGVYDCNTLNPAKMGSLICDLNGVQVNSNQIGVSVNFTTWRCPNSTTCILDDWLLDGVNDCGDWSDEDYCRQPYPFCPSANSVCVFNPSPRANASRNECQCLAGFTGNNPQLACVPITTTSTTLTPPTTTTTKAPQPPAAAAVPNSTTPAAAPNTTTAAATTKAATVALATTARPANATASAIVAATTAKSKASSLQATTSALQMTVGFAFASVLAAYCLINK